MKFSTRRFTGSVIKLVGRHFADYAEELQDWIEKITRQVEGGIPAGFNDIVPEPIVANDGSSGTESLGWAAADHEHDGRHTLMDGSLHTDTGSATPSKGMLIVGTNTPGWSALAPGGVDGQVLTRDGGSSSGVKWAPPASSPSLASSESLDDAALFSLVESYALRDLLARNYR